VRKTTTVVAAVGLADGDDWYWATHPPGSRWCVAILLFL